MAPIDTLPPETHLERLKHVRALDVYPIRGVPSLCAAALVASRWRRPAQAVLSSDIRFYKEDDGAKLMASEAFGVYHCMYLSVNVESQRRQAIRDELTKSGAVRSLTLGCTRDVEFFSTSGLNCASILSAAAISWCRRLHWAALLRLALSTATDHHPLTPIDISFRLTTLNLRYTSIPPRLIEAIFSASSLQALTIWHSSNPARLQGVLDHLPLLAASLTKLDLSINRSWVIPTFTALAECTGLVHLSVEHAGSDVGEEEESDSDDSDDDDELSSRSNSSELILAMAELSCTLEVLGIGVWSVPRPAPPVFAAGVAETRLLVFLVLFGEFRRIGCGGRILGGVLGERDQGVVESRRECVPFSRSSGAQKADLATTTRSGSDQFLVGSSRGGDGTEGRNGLMMGGGAGEVEIWFDTRAPHQYRRLWERGRRGSEGLRKRGSLSRGGGYRRAAKSVDPCESRARQSSRERA